MLEERATGLVPGFTYQPSSMIVGSEQVLVLVVKKGGVTCLPVDKDASRARWTWGATAVG